MPEQITFEDFQDAMKPLHELLSGIVSIVEELDDTQIQEKTKDLLNQIFLSVMIIHLSQEMNGKNVPTKEELEEKVSNNDQMEVYKQYMSGLTQEKLEHYFNDSTSIIMTNYYFETKEKMTQDKLNKINELYTEIQQRS